MTVVILSPNKKLPCFIQFMVNSYPSLVYKKLPLPLQRIVKDMSVSDLPTPKTCKSGVFEKERAPKNRRRLGPQTCRFPKYVRNKTNKADYSDGILLSWYSLSYWWSLLYCLVYLLAVIRRFCFTENADKAFPQT